VVADQVETQWQVEIPAVTPIVTKFNVVVGLAIRHPKVTSHHPRTPYV